MSQTILGLGMLYHVGPQHVSLVTCPLSLPTTFFLYPFSFLQLLPLRLAIRSKFPGMNLMEVVRKGDKHKDTQKSWVWPTGLPDGETAAPKKLPRVCYKQLSREARLLYAAGSGRQA